MNLLLTAKYPHVYGAINIDAIIDVVPFSKENGNLYYQRYKDKNVIYKLVRKAQII